VYRAVEREAREVCVVKRLRPELSDRADSVAQFEDEARLGSALVHPNIVGVRAHGRVGAEHYIAQEYVAGRDLDQVVRRSLEVDGRPLPPHVVLHVAREALQALAYAHARAGASGAPLGLVHRDVSPNNLLVSWGGEVKLFDFGIVKAEGRVTRTQYGVVKGNVVFMAPEQACGDALDGRADLFSLGLVLFYALTGTYLYAHGNTIQLLTHAAGGPTAAERAQVAALPAPFGEAVGRALAVRRDARYADAAAFLAALPPAPGGAEATAAFMRRLFAREVREEAAALEAALGQAY
jgi:eukaryotic-like serine/threonine-protein kinase